MPGWEGSNRRERLPRDWPLRRLIRLKLDNFECQAIRADTGEKCRAYANQCDHIVHGDDHRIENLQSLCEWHHLRKSGGEGGRANAQKRRKAQPQHPGIIP